MVIDYEIEKIQRALHDFNIATGITIDLLKDTCARVGGDPARKLSPDDRLIGAAKTALAQGIVPAYIAVGADAVKAGTLGAII